MTTATNEKPAEKCWRTSAGLSHQIPQQRNEGNPMLTHTNATTQCDTYEWCVINHSDPQEITPEHNTYHRSGDIAELTVRYATQLQGEGIKNLDIAVWDEGDGLNVHFWPDINVSFPVTNPQTFTDHLRSIADQLDFIAEGLQEKSRPLVRRTEPGDLGFDG